MLAGLISRTKLAIALGVGIGSVVIVVTCVIIGFVIWKRQKSAPGCLGFGKPAQSHCLITTSQPAAGPATRDTPFGMPTLCHGLASGKTLGEHGPGISGLQTSAALATSTALDLLSEPHGPFVHQPVPTEPGVLDASAPSVTEQPQSSHSRKPETLHTMPSEDISREDAETSSGMHDEVDGLWTRGVDPGDVEIQRDAHGQAIVIGRGAYAVVYLGRWQATLVAVKVMLSGDSEPAQRELRAEADILRGLRHPNVVLLMAICIHPNQQVSIIYMFFSFSI
jgi:hypothetical protein